jgi:hypothetical protein
MLYYWGLNIQHSVATNSGGFTNSTYDQLYAQSAQEMNRKVRTQQLFKMQEIIAEQVPGVLIYEVPNPYAISKDFGGIPGGWWVAHSENDEYVYWKKGIKASFEDVQKLIAASQAELDRLQSQLYDVGKAKARLNEASNALSKGDLIGAYRLATEATALPEPPYAIYAAGVFAVIVVSGILVYVWRRRRART